MLSLSLFTNCTEDYDECFYLTDEMETKVYALKEFTQIETFVPGEYTFKQGKVHQIKITAHPRYIDSINRQVHHKTLSISNLFPFVKTIPNLR